MKDETKTPRARLVDFRDQVRKLLALKPQLKEVQISAEELVREMAQFAHEHPEFLEALGRLEEKLIDEILSVSNGQKEGAA